MMYKVPTLFLFLGLAIASPKPQAGQRVGRHIDGSQDGNDFSGRPSNTYLPPGAVNGGAGGNIGGANGGFQGGGGGGGGRVSGPAGQYGPPTGGTGFAGNGGFNGGSQRPSGTYGAPTAGEINSGFGGVRGQNGGGIRGGAAGGRGSNSGGGGRRGGGGKSGGFSFGVLGDAAKWLTDGLSLDGISDLGRGLELNPTFPLIGQVNGGPNNCICPDKNGWSNEHLVQNQRYTNITAGKFDCYCIGNAGFVVFKRGSGGGGGGNFGANGGTSGNFGFNRGNSGSFSGGFNGGGGGSGGYPTSNGDTGGNGGYPPSNGGRFEGGQNAAFDSFPRPSSNNANSQPTMSCFCPKPSGWTYAQLNLLQRQRNFAGGAGDCYCANPSDVPPELVTQLREMRIDTGGDTGEKSHLAIVSIDADLKEVRLGPLLVELT